MCIYSNIIKQKNYCDVCDKRDYLFSSAGNSIVPLLQITFKR